MESVTGNDESPTEKAQRFSPFSNNRPEITKANRELRVLIATDVLSEGQNLQDSHVVLNYDLPWAIIRLIQRAGRVDRIGQKAEQILCYSFLPEDGIESIIKLKHSLMATLSILQIYTMRNQVYWMAKMMIRRSIWLLWRIRFGKTLPMKTLL